MKHRSSPWLVGLVLLVSIDAAAAHAQAGIEVLASVQRDGIEVRNGRAQVGIADDGTIAFPANTPAGINRLFLAVPGRGAQDVRVAADSLSDVAINDDSILFMNGSMTWTRT
jgi:hypothetical protein